MVHLVRRFYHGLSVTWSWQRLAGLNSCLFFLTTYVYPRLCVAGGGNSSTGDTNLTIISSAEQYFKRGVLKEDTDLSKGLGAPDLQLALCLAGCWVLLFLTMWKGVASSGKVSSLDPPIEIEYLPCTGCLLHRHIPLRGSDHPARPWSHAAWRHRGRLVLHHTKVVRAPQPQGQKRKF